MNEQKAEFCRMLAELGRQLERQIEVASMDVARLSGRVEALERDRKSVV